MLKRQKIQEKIAYYDQPRNSLGKFTKCEPPELDSAEDQAAFTSSQQLYNGAAPSVTLINHHNE